MGLSLLKQSMHRFPALLLSLTGRGVFPSQMALYFCTGVLEDETLFRHYALNVPLYTHFTSPIRRFADILVHRLLSASLGKCLKGAARSGLVESQAERLLPGASRLGREDTEEAAGFLGSAVDLDRPCMGVDWSLSPCVPGPSAHCSCVYNSPASLGPGSHSLVLQQAVGIWPPVKQGGGSVATLAGSVQWGFQLRAARGTGAHLWGTPAPYHQGAHQSLWLVSLPGMGRPVRMRKEAIQKQADHCNDRKMASKRVQELSADLFFAIFVRVRPQPPLR